MAGRRQGLAPSRALLTHIAERTGRGPLAPPRWRTPTWPSSRSFRRRRCLRRARALILETLRAIDATLQALPARTREIFLMSQFDGMGYDDIARRLDVSLSTVKRRMQAALTAC